MYGLSLCVNISYRMCHGRVVFLILPTSLILNEAHVEV
jgi:hypothetical protein